MAPKPHQEEIEDTNNFIWHFCINCMHINQLTKVISHCMPHCNDAIEFGFGRASVFFLLDTFTGYHQIKMELESAKKTAFAAPGSKKCRCNVMPFGVVNSPSVCIMMTCDLKDV